MSERASMRRIDRRDVLGIVAGGLILGLLLALTMPWADINSRDHLWYVNRAQRLGDYGPEDLLTQLYGVGYPAVVWLVSRLFHDMIAATLIVNALWFCALLVGVYILGAALYNRTAAWIAVAFVATRPFFLFETHARIDPYGFSVAFLVWLAVAFWLLVRYRTILMAVLLGLLLGCAVFVRFEFVLYAGFLLPAAVLIYRAEHSWWRAARLVLISGAVLVPASLVYLHAMLAASGNGSHYAAFMLAEALPASAGLISERLADTLVNTIRHAPVWAWLVALGAVLWPGKQSRWLSILLAMVVPFSMAYVFLLSGWPLDIYLTHALPFVGLLFGAGLVRLKESWPVYGRYVIPAAILLLVVPGLAEALSWKWAGILEYRDVQAYQDGPAVDAWLAEQGDLDTDIFTFCRSVVPFSRAKFHVIYRLATKDVQSHDWWSSPDQLMPYMRETGKLFMTCGDPDSHVMYFDWIDYFQARRAFTYHLEEIGQANGYSFYRAVQGEP